MSCNESYVNVVSLSQNILLCYTYNVQMLDKGRIYVQGSGGREISPRCSEWHAV